MPTNLTEKRRRGFFIAHEANGTISRETVTLIAGQNLEAGSVLGKITASDKYTLLAPGAGDGSEVADAILWDTVDATLADKTVVIIFRIAEVTQEALNYGGATAPQIVTARAQLKDNKNIKTLD